MAAHRPVASRESLVQLKLHVDAAGREQVCDATCLGLRRARRERHAASAAPPRPPMERATGTVVEDRGHCVDVMFAHGDPRATGTIQSSHTRS